MSHWPDDQAVLAHFRDWLDETRRELDESPGLDDALRDGEADAAPVGLLKVIEEFTALRHEVKLHTKSARGLVDQHDQLLAAAGKAVERLDQAKVDAEGAVHKASKPLAEGLMDLDESLVRGRRGIEAARTRLIEESHQELTDLRRSLDELFELQPWWRRALCKPWHEAVKSLYFRRALELQRGVFDSLLEGYGLMQSRLRRTLLDNEIRRMECVGRMVDPHEMTVVETAVSEQHPPGWVLEELRFGYFWRGNVHRFAEVKAAEGRV